MRDQAEMQAAAREAAARLAAAGQAAEEASAAGRAAAERQEELGRNVVELEARCGRLQAERDASRRWLETLEEDRARRDMRTPATPGGGGAAASAAPAAATAAAASAAAAASPSRVATLEQRERLGEAARSELEAKAAEHEAAARAAKAAQRTAEQEAAQARRAEAAAAERSASLEALLAASQARRAQLEASSLEGGGGGGAAGERDYDARMLVDDQTLGGAPPPAAGHKVLHLTANPARGAKDSTLEALRARLSSLECELEASRIPSGGGGGEAAGGGPGAQAAQAALQAEVGELKAAKASLETQKVRPATLPPTYCAPLHCLQPTAPHYTASNLLRPTILPPTICLPPATRHAPRATRHSSSRAARCAGAAEDDLQRAHLRVPQDRDAAHGLPRRHGRRDEAVRGPPLYGHQGRRPQVPLQQGGRHGAAAHRVRHAPIAADRDLPAGALHSPLPWC